jgi:transposase
LSRKSDSLPPSLSMGDRFMARGYSDDLRIRVIRHVEDGASRRGSARLFSVGDATVVRWFQRWSQTGEISAKPGKGHSRSPLKSHETWLLDLVAATPDLTLEEIRQKLFETHGLKPGIGSVWRFFNRHGISFKKKRPRDRAGPA